MPWFFTTPGKMEKPPTKYNAGKGLSVEGGAMKLEKLVHHLESQLIDLFTRSERQERARERDAALARTRDDVSRLQDHLDRVLARRSEIAQRLEPLTQDAALLPSQIESSFRRGKSAQALRQAMELERLRRDMDALRGELARLDQAAWSLGFRLRQLRRRLASLRGEMPC